jgi:hypothetical protein
MDIKKTKLGIAAGLLTLSFSMAAQSQTKELPFPSFPASFKVAEYKGQKGCIVDDFRAIFAVAKNEGLDFIGLHPQVETPKDGVYIMDVLYSKENGYGYIIENRGHEKRCINQKLTNLSSQNDVSLKPVKISKTIETTDCTFDPQILNLCGSLQQLSNRLLKAGYSIDWQAQNEDGNINTMLSGTGQSFILTTHAKTGATIFTGVGKGEFKFSEAPK